MAATDSTQPQIPTELAMTLGEIKEGQKSLVKAVDDFRLEVKDELKSVVATTTAQGTEIATLKTRQDAIEKTVEERKPAKVAWTAVGAFIISGLMGLYALAERLLSGGQ